MKLQNDLGEIRISSEVFTAITGSAATNCYGVKGMAVLIPDIEMNCSFLADTIGVTADMEAILATADEE